MKRLWLLMGFALAAAWGAPNAASPTPTPSPLPVPQATPIYPIRSMWPYASDVPVQLSNYWPPNGGPNCFMWWDGWCQSPTGSGLPWELAVGLGGQAAACPPEWPLFSLVLLKDLNRVLICLDRGGAIRCENGLCRVDVLSPYAHDGIHVADVYAPFWRIYGWSSQERSTPTPTPGGDDATGVPTVPPTPTGTQ